LKYFALVGGTEREVVLEERGGVYVVRVGDRVFEIEAGEGDGPDDLVLRLGGRVLSASFEERGEEVRVSSDGETWLVSIEDERERAAHAAERGGEAGPRLVRSPMPGFVVAVLVAEGEEVRSDQTLLILEAMKMQNEIRAPGAGRVAKLHVKAGDTVGASAPLVTVG
jgi:biotin carboxyl carrier protein